MKTSLTEILDGLDLTAEEKQQVGALLGNEKVRGRIDGELKNVQSEFSRSLDESRATVAQAKADKDAYFGQMSDWRERQEATLRSVQEQARRDREAAAQIRARMESLTGAGRLDREDWEGFPEVNTPPAGPGPGAGASPDPNENKWVTQQEGMQYLQYTPMLLDLQAEHQAVTGKPLGNATELVNEAFRTGKPLREVWETKYTIPKLKEEQAARIQQEHDDKIRREERTKVMSEISNPTARSPVGAFQSPVLVAAAKAPQNSVPTVGSRRGVEMAMAAHAAGKYDGGVAHTTP